MVPLFQVAPQSLQNFANLAAPDERPAIISRIPRYTAPHSRWPTWMQPVTMAMRAPPRDPRGTEVTLQPAPRMAIPVEPFRIPQAEPLPVPHVEQQSVSHAPSQAEPPQGPPIPPMPPHVAAALRDEAPGTHHHHYYYQAPPSEGPSARDALAQESKLDTRRPELFNGRERCKWKPFVTECLMTFFTKPVTFQGDHEKVTFAASYLTETTQSHYTSLLQYNPDHPALHSWEGFIREFGGMFGVVNTQIKVDQTLRRLQMTDLHHFSNHIIRFKASAFESNWNSAALQSELYRSLPICIKEAMKVILQPSTSQ